MGGGGGGEEIKVGTDPSKKELVARHSTCNEGGRRRGAFTLTFMVHALPLPEFHSSGFQCLQVYPPGYSYRWLSLLEENRTKIISQDITCYE